MATITKPSQYNWSKLEFEKRMLNKHYSKLGGKIDKRFCVVHHMTVVGHGTGSALDACYNIWQNRQASAHLGVDGFRISQFVWDKDFAWACADTYGNTYGISVEHANSTGGPKWEVGSDTWHTGARLIAQLHYNYKMGRPKAGKTLFQHSDFYATACAGPYLGKKIWKAYCREVRRVYDLLVKDSGYTKPKKTKPKKNTPSKTLNQYSPKDFRWGSKGRQITLLGKALVKHGFGKHYKFGPGPNMGPADIANVKDFQRAQGWRGKDADGYPGPETLKRLAGTKKRKSRAKTLSSYRASDFPPHGKSKGNHITLLGKALVKHGYGGYYKVGPGPNWGSADKANVKAFQHAQGWRGKDADGYVGPETLKRLSK